MARRLAAHRPLGSLARLGSVGLRIALAVVVAVAGARALRQYAAYRAVLSTPGLPGLERALELDPTQPDFLFSAGLLYRDSIENQDLERAERYLDEAIRLNPAMWTYRFEKGRLLEIRGDLEEAERVLLEALALTPHDSAHRWQIANFFVRRGNVARALEHLQIAIAGSRDLQEPAFALLRGLGLEPGRMVAAWPHDAGSSRRLLTALIGTPPAPVAVASQPAIRELWRRMLESPDAVSLGDVAYYLRYLLQQGLLTEARAEWVRATTARGWIDQDFVAGRNYVWNGGFELPLAKGALTWNVAEQDSVPASSVRVNGAPEGEHALTLDLGRGGTGNFRSLSQQVVVDGDGPFQLSFSARATDGRRHGAYVLEVLLLPERRLVFASPTFRPTADWEAVTGTFALSSGDGEPRWLLLRLRPAAGVSDTIPTDDRLWLDSFALTLVRSSN